MGKGFYRKCMLVGPGGTRCYCCFPQNGTKAASRYRYKLFKIGKRRFNRFVSKLMDE